VRLENSLINANFLNGEWWSQEEEAVPEKGKELDDRRPVFSITHDN
jgi:hypothetical protein